jgi:hypothetical protein
MAHEDERRRVVRVSLTAIGIIAGAWLIFTAFYLSWFVLEQLRFWHHVLKHGCGGRC